MLETKYHYNCRACGSLLTTVWDLGKQHIVRFGPMGQPQPEQERLELTRCTSARCLLVQLRDTVSPERLFREYWYRSGVNESMVAALKDIVDKARALVNVGADDHVMDIGANDGTLLSHYRPDLPRPYRVAVEPARNLLEECINHADVMIPTFFPFNRDTLHKAESRFKVISAVAMLYDLEQPRVFLTEVRRLLHPEGVFVAQLTDLWSMLEASAFDGICHEHLEYYSLATLIELFGTCGLTIQQVEWNGVNGGSLRVWARHSALRIMPDASVFEYLRREAPVAATAGAIDHAISALRERVDQARAKVRDILQAHANTGGFLTAYGASTKGLTLAQYFGFGVGAAEITLDAVADRNPAKFGLGYGWTGAEIISEEEWRTRFRPEANLAIVLPWHFRAGILERERAWLEQGGKFLFPLPVPMVVSR